MPLVFLGSMKQEPEIHLCSQAIKNVDSDKGTWLHYFTFCKITIQGDCFAKNRKFFNLRRFALIIIVSAHAYCARTFTCHVMHRACALNTKLNNNRADGHCYSFA